jgi:molecular chaperone HtpG
MDKHPFLQAEVKQILHLVTHSLYSNKEIFLREMISNASDACDKLRFEAIDHPELYEGQTSLDIRVASTRMRTITITDNGIGLSSRRRSPTWARSPRAERASSCIGARGRPEEGRTADRPVRRGLFRLHRRRPDHGRVAPRRPRCRPRGAGLGGRGDFDVETITRPERGTSVILHLREGEEEFLSGWKLRSIISKYSDHIAADPDAEGGVGRGGEEGHGANGRRQQGVGALDAAEGEITKEQYEEFYKQISYDSDAPLAYTHNRVEGRTEYTQLLYIPAKAPFDLWNRDKRGGVKLYVRRVFIMDDAEALMPVYLRFVKGVIDSSDLPLNVSRELLQESRDVKAIREGSTKRVLSMLEGMAESEDAAEKEKYAAFWNDFGVVMKEGIGEDFANRERLAKLYRFSSTDDESGVQTVSLPDYVKRMKEGQEAIYYVTADTLATARSSPQLEIFRKKGIEVLLLTDRVDEWLLSHLYEFDGHPLQSVARGSVDLGKLADEAEKKHAEEAATAFKPTLERLKVSLKDRAKDVRVTTRLVDSPACLVVEEGDMSGHLARLLKQAGQGAPTVQPILEVNAEHPLVKRLETSERFDDLAAILFDQAMLAEGGQLEDPAAYVRRVNALLLA